MADLLGIPPFIADWIVRDPLRSVILFGCLCAVVWSAFNLHPDGEIGGGSDCGEGGDGGGD